MGLDRSLDEEGIPDLEGPLPEKAATGDPQEGVAPPSDRPALDDWGVTAQEQREDEPLDAKLARERPDVFDDPDRLARIDEAVDDPRGGEPAEEAAMHTIEE